MRVVTGALPPPPPEAPAPPCRGPARAGRDSARSGRAAPAPHRRAIRSPRCGPTCRRPRPPGASGRGAWEPAPRLVTDDVDRSPDHLRPAPRRGIAARPPPSRSSRRQLQRVGGEAAGGERRERRRDSGVSPAHAWASSSWNRRHCAGAVVIRPPSRAKLWQSRPERLPWTQRFLYAGRGDAAAA